jgi:transposase
MPAEANKRRHYTAEQKAEIVRRHLVDKVPVSDLCEEYGIQPSLFYSWQKQVFDNLAGVFDRAEGGRRAQAARDGELARKEQRIAQLEARLAKKDAVIAEISEEHLELKKTLGVP